MREVDYESGDESILAPYMKALQLNPEILLNVPQAVTPYSTGGYPYHCPVESCWKRFCDSSHVFKHWRTRMHDQDRGNRGPKDIDGLLTARNRCAKSKPEDPTVCANCIRYDDLQKTPGGGGDRRGRKRVRTEPEK